MMRRKVLQANRVRRTLVLCLVLRACTAAKAEAGADPSSVRKSGVPGVSWHRAGQRWVARPSLGRKQRHLGYFAEEAEAAEAVAAARAADEPALLTTLTAMTFRPSFR